MGVEDSHDVDIKLDDDGSLDIYEDTHYYIHVNKISFSWINTQGTRLGCA
jgi:hypothetical protein